WHPVAWGIIATSGTSSATPRQAFSRISEPHEVPLRSRVQPFLNRESRRVRRVACALVLHVLRIDHVILVERRSRSAKSLYRLCIIRHGPGSAALHIAATSGGPVEQSCQWDAGVVE